MASLQEQTNKAHIAATGRWPWLWRWRAMLLAGIALGCSSIALVVGPVSAEMRHAAALSRWRERGPAHYRLVGSFGPNCLIDVEVRAGEVVAYNRWDSCVHPARTVEDLFQLIERGAERQGCFLAGCTCRLSIVTRARYDPIYGYPEVVTMRLARSPNLWSESYWRNLIQWRRLPECNRVAETEIARVVSLIPLTDDE